MVKTIDVPGVGRGVVEGWRTTRDGRRLMVVVVRPKGEVPIRRFVADDFG